MDKLRWQAAGARAYVTVAILQGLHIFPNPVSACAAEQMQAAIRGLILLDIDIPMMWERVATLKLGPRLDECTHHLYLEVMGK